MLYRCVCVCIVRCLLVFFSIIMQCSNYCRTTTTTTTSIIFFFFWFFELIVFHFDFAGLLNLVSWSQLLSIDTEPTTKILQINVIGIAYAHLIGIFKIVVLPCTKIWSHTRILLKASHDMNFKYTIISLVDNDLDHSSFY